MKTTSIEAHNEYKDKKQKDYDLIMSVVSNTPLTYREIFKILWLKKYAGQRLSAEQAYKIAVNFNPSVISRRTSEMVRLGMLEEREARKCREGRKKCTTYIKVEGQKLLF